MPENGANRADDKRLRALTGKLGGVPRIVADLGLGIAEAQQAMDANYVEQLARVMNLVSETFNADGNGSGDVASGQPEEQPEEPSSGPSGGNGSGQEEDEDAGRVSDADLLSLVKALAPSRYQFTETTLEFRADLSESGGFGVEAGVGVGMSAVMVNAAFSASYGYDVRAAARVQTVLHAHPADKAAAERLLSRAKEVKADGLKLPSEVDLDKHISEQLKDIRMALSSKKKEAK